MKAEFLSETLVSAYNFMRRYYPEEKLRHASRILQKIYILNL